MRGGGVGIVCAGGNVYSSLSILGLCMAVLSPLSVEERFLWSIVDCIPSFGGRY